MDQPTNAVYAKTDNLIHVHGTLPPLQEHVSYVTPADHRVQRMRMQVSVLRDQRRILN